MVANWLEKVKMPVLIRNYTDDEAVIVMVDSNIQRENLLPSEKAYAYKMKMDAVKHQGIKDENAASVDSADLVGQAAGDSGKNRSALHTLDLSYSGIAEIVG